jgi:hypothetical protein
MRPSPSTGHVLPESLKRGIGPRRTVAILVDLGVPDERIGHYLKVDAAVITALRDARPQPAL